MPKDKKVIFRIANYNKTCGENGENFFKNSKITEKFDCQHLHIQVLQVETPHINTNVSPTPFFALIGRDNIFLQTAHHVKLKNLSHKKL